MNVIGILMVSFGLSLDVFAIMLCKGSLLSKISKPNLLKACLVFSIWQICALLMGNLITKFPFFSSSGKKVSNLWYSISAFIFIFLGCYMFFKAHKKKPFLEHLENEFPLKIICVWALLTSIDTFFSGIGFGFLNTGVFLEAILLLIMTNLFIFLGTYTGYLFGFKHRNSAYLLGGILFIAAAFDVMIRHY